MSYYILVAALFILPLTNVIVIEPIISIMHNCKEILALFFCLLFISSRQLSNKIEFKKVNVSLCLTMIFLIFSINAAPQIKLLYNNTNIGNLWSWKPFAISLIYFFFYLSLIGLPLKNVEKKGLLQIIAITAVLSSAYAILQALGLDQAQSVKTVEQIGSPDASHITAMIGNPTYLSIYLVACLPFVWQYMRPFSFLVAIVIIICKSDTGYLGLALMTYILIMSKLKNKQKTIVSILLAIICIFVLFKKHDKLVDNGRFIMWKQSISEFYSPTIKMPITKEMSKAQKNEVEKLNSKKHVMTGLGLGSFSIFHNKGKSFKFAGSMWTSAHNVYLEILYSIGIIGLLLFLSSIFESLKHFYCKKIKQKNDFLILFSFIFLLLSSFLHSTIHVEPLRFLMSFLFCLIQL